MNNIISVYLIGLSIWDIRFRKLPIGILVVGMIGGVVYCIFDIGIVQIVLGMIPGIIVLAVAIFIPNCIGVGDGMLAIVYGLLYGWKDTCIWLLLSFWLAAVFGVLFQCLKKESKICMPFIPFLTLVHIGMCF